MTERYSENLSVMQNLCLTIARFAPAAWVGAAALFVVTSIREQTAPAFDQVTRDALAVLRFPDYYAFGFTLIGTALVCALVARNHPAVSRLRAWVSVGLLAAALLLTVADYLWIYRPLAEMLDPPGRSRPAEFDAYHKASMWINLIDVGMCLAAAVVLSAPRRTCSSQETRAAAGRADFDFWNGFSGRKMAGFGVLALCVLLFNPL
jgi:hypothetical protein